MCEFTQMTDSLDAVLCENQSLYQKVQALTAENKRLRVALEEIKTESGTSTKTWHIAEKALGKK